MDTQQLSRSGRTVEKEGETEREREIKRGKREESREGGW